ERRYRRPGLRRARHRIERRRLAALALEAAEELRQPREMHVRRGVEKRGGERERLGAVAVARKSERDHRVVMRPYRAVVIGRGVEAPLAPRERADAPAAEEIGLEEALRHARGALPGGDAGEEHLAGIGAPHAAGALRAVEGERIGAELLVPVGLLELPAQLLRLEREA